MAKDKQTQDAAVEAAVQEQPSKGGSYIRNPDGSLQRDDGKSTSDMQKRPATYPADKAKGE